MPLTRPTRIGLATLLAGITVLLVFSGLWQVIHL
jgi:hypothetical protein